MAFTATNLWFFDIFPGFVAIGAQLHAAHESGLKWAANCGAQLQEFTGICTRNSRRRAGPAQIRSPAMAGSLEQAALFYRAATKVIPIKIFAFNTDRSSHDMRSNLIDNSRNKKYG